KIRLQELLEDPNLHDRIQEIMRLRLDVDELTIRAAHANMLYHGGAGYLKHSHPSRRLRETYFLLNLTPTVKHLEKELSSVLRHTILSITKMRTGKFPYGF